jgi:hypothetical protein
MADQRAGGPAVPRSWTPFAVVGGIVLVLALFIQTGPGRSLTGSLGLSGHTTPYTELFFSAPRDLPEQVTDGKPPENASFVIGNRMTSAQKYHWTAFAVHGKKEVKLGEADIALASGAEATVKPPAVKCTPGPITYVIRLKGRPETLSILARCV